MKMPFFLLIGSLIVARRAMVSGMLNPARF